MSKEAIKKVVPPGIEKPPYLPHLSHPEVLQMGLAPLGNSPWIETDSSLHQFHAHKISERKAHDSNVYRCAEHTLDAQRELADLLLQHLTLEQPEYYELYDDHLLYKPTKLQLPLPGNEPLWNASLWVADDLILLTDDKSEYTLTAASLCSPSHWRLQDKFGQPLWQVHDPIPGFKNALTPRIDRFLQHLRAEHPVVRYNWSLQAGSALHPDPESPPPVQTSTKLFYRTERQTLRRLPRTEAIAFTIRVYLHPLDCIDAIPGATQALFKAIADTPAALARYKGFDQLAPALSRYAERHSRKSI